MKNRHKSTENWQGITKQLKDYFATIQLPEKFALDAGSVVVDPAKFIDRHLAVVENNNGVPTYKPYLERLIKAKDVLTNLEKQKRLAANLQIGQNGLR